MLTPARLVPVLGHDGLTLTQSLATIEYLEEIHPTPSLLPGDAASRARIRAIAQHIACEIHPLNNLRVLQRLESSAGTDKHARDHWYAHWVTEGFKALEAMLAGTAHTGRFCHGDSPTMADCCLVPQVYTPSATRCPWSPIRRCDASTTPAFNCRHSMAPRRKFRPMRPDYKHKETQMLKGKSALITGSTSGIGLGVATALAEAGANVILNGFGEASEIERIRAGLAERTGVEVIYDVAVKRPLP